MFEKLEVYQRAVDFTEHVLTLTQRFPHGFYFLADQLNRAALSVPANIAEGNGRFTKGDRKHFFVIARGSLQECVPLLEIASRKDLLDKSKQKELAEELETMAKMLSGLIKGVDRRLS